MLKFNAERYKFHRYCELYSEFFDDGETLFKKGDFENLIEKIASKFHEMKIYQRVCKEIILKDILDEYKDINELNMTPFINITLSLIVSLIIALFNKSIFILVEIFIFLLGAMSLYFLFIEIKNYVRKVSYRGFYLMCLNVLDKVNSGVTFNEENKKDSK